jgi:flagellar biosynthesis/type III secretory pathway chaperone
MKLESLKEKRQKLVARLKAIDEQIARAERAAREQEQREMLRLLQSRGITAAQLAELLNSGSGDEKDGVPAQ